MRMLDPKHLTVVIVDDEAPARALIREYLEQHADVHVVAECTNGLEAVKAANELKPDLLFLDIQMPKLDGFEVLDLIGRDAAGVVFTTAYDDYALRAFEVHAVDYLLKPFGPERFAESLKLARSLITQREPIPARELLETHRGRTQLPEGTNARRTRGAACGQGILAHPPPFYSECVAAGKNRTVRKRQPHGHSQRQDRATHQPFGLRKAARFAVRLSRISAIMKHQDVS